MPSDSRPLSTSARIVIARNLSRLLKSIGTHRVGRHIIQALRDNSVTGRALQWLLAFNGRFDTIAAAEHCARRYFSQTHDHPYHNRAHANFSEITRESDYPVLYHLAPIAPHLRSVFDLGGSIGNMFYSFDRELHFSRELRWVIHDLPHKKGAALEYASSKNEDRVHFTEKWSDASGADLLMAVGVVHYFEEQLAVMLRRLDHLPKFVMINRSPFSPAGDIITVQDGLQYAIPCKLHDVDTFLAGMIDLGYRLVARWPVHERRTRICLYPELNGTYLGFFFALEELPPAASRANRDL